jgi:hypothetical protein
MQQLALEIGRSVVPHSLSPRKGAGPPDGQRALRSQQKRAQKRSRGNSLKTGCAYEGERSIGRCGRIQAGSDRLNMKNGVRSG